MDVQLMASTALKPSELSEIAKLSGMEKAATFMLALGQEFGGAIWEQLTDDEIKELSTAISLLGSVKAQTVEKLFIVFAAEVSAVGSLHRTIIEGDIARRSSTANHGGNSWPCGPHDVGQVRQCERRCPCCLFKE
jgi:FliG N-terminal domain